MFRSSKKTETPKSIAGNGNKISLSIFGRGTDKKFRDSGSDKNGRSPVNVVDAVDHINTKPLVLDNTRWERRLQKELMAMIKEPPPGVSVATDKIGPNLSEWIINIDGVAGTLYEGEHFKLLFKFNDKYPFDSPEVTFIGTNIPVHPHVYSNGHICLSILTDDWSPALSVPSVCLSISSMLSSCTEKKRPPDNTLYVKTCNKNPKKTKWWYHDDSV